MLTFKTSRPSGYLAVFATGLLVAGCNSQTKSGYFTGMSVPVIDSDLYIGSVPHPKPAPAPSVSSLPSSTPSSKPSAQPSASPSVSPSVSPSPSPSAIACGGLGGSEVSSGAANDGLVATLSYFSSTPTENQSSSVSNMIKYGTPVDVKLFFNQLDVPNTAFSAGFPLTSGGVIQAGGQPLIEWFALDFNSLLKLGPNDLPGDYEFAIMADDGAVLQLDSKMVVNNDGQHPATVECSSGTVSMNASSLVKFHLSYYQGPRYYIALTVLWRRVHEASTSDSACGAGVDDISGMLSRGWKVIGPENYQLPGVNAVNPCATPVTPTS